MVNHNNTSSVSQPVGEKMTAVGGGSNVTAPVEVRSKENIKIEPPKVNNFIGVDKISTDDFDKKSQANHTVLSATGQ